MAAGAKITQYKFCEVVTRYNDLTFSQWKGTVLKAVWNVSSSKSY